MTEVRARVLGRRSSRCKGLEVRDERSLRASQDWGGQGPGVGCPENNLHASWALSPEHGPAESAVDAC